ncbi:hypothetical protein AN958_12669, partial [Leucoagaricus sp. SymC.cos]
LRQSNLKGLQILRIKEKILASLFANNTLIYMLEDDKIFSLKEIIDNFCRASTAKFNYEKTEILPMGEKKYIESQRMTRKHSKTIPITIWIIKERESMRTLGAWVGNHTNQYPQ